MCDWYILTSSTIIGLLFKDCLDKIDKLSGQTALLLYNLYYKMPRILVRVFVLGIEIKNLIVKAMDW